MDRLRFIFLREFKRARSLRGTCVRPPRLHRELRYTIYAAGKNVLLKKPTAPRARDGLMNRATFMPAKTRAPRVHAGKKRERERERESGVLTRPEMPQIYGSGGRRVVFAYTCTCVIYRGTAIRGRRSFSYAALHCL